MVDWSSPVVTQCVIGDNSAGDVGGGIYSYSTNTDPLLTNCTISGNSARLGGGVAFDQNSPEMLNCTIADNSATDNGGGINCSDASPSIVNCILWGDTLGGSGNEMGIQGTSAPTLDYCDINVSACPTGASCTACLFDDDPLFVGGSPFDYHLTASSPCIDSGTDDSGTWPHLPDNDIDGDDRPLVFGFDMGSDEVICIENNDITIKADGTGDYATIQEGIDAICEGYSVLLEDGTYTGVGNRDIDFMGKSITLRSVNDDPDTCIIDCENSSRGVYFHTSEGAGSVLRGITIKNGSADYGGGVFCENNASPTFENCIFDSHSASINGGGMLIDTGAPVLIDCVIISSLFI
jgi:predicted outer membrane repeat protein